MTSEPINKLIALERRVKLLEMRLEAFDPDLTRNPFRMSPKPMHESNVASFNSPRYNPAGWIIAVLADAERDMLVEAIADAIQRGATDAPKRMHDTLNDASSLAASVVRDFDSGLDRSGDGVALHSISHPNWPTWEDMEAEIANRGTQLASRLVTIEALTKERDALRAQVDADLDKIEADRRMIETLRMELTQAKAYPTVEAYEAVCKAHNSRIEANEKLTRELAEARQGRWPEVVQSLNDGIDQVKRLQAENAQLKAALLQQPPNQAQQQTRQHGVER